MRRKRPFTANPRTGPTSGRLSSAKATAAPTLIAGASASIMIRTSGTHSLGWKAADLPSKS